MEKKILVIDDDRLMLKSLELLLIEAGYQVKAVSEAELITRAIRDFIPDLLLMDIRFENADGRLICDDLKKHPETQDLPIILITAISYEEISAIECNADAIIGKPYHGDFLLQHIDQLIHRNRLL